MLIKSIIRFFDKLEDKIRGKLSQYPILYAFIGGVGIVLFWRGVWHTADDINLSSGFSLILGGFILLMTGMFVYEFIGSRIVISGMAGEKKLEEKQENQLETEESQIKNLQATIRKLEEKIDHIDKEMEGKK